MVSELNAVLKRSACTEKRTGKGWHSDRCLSGRGRFQIDEAPHIFAFHEVEIAVVDVYRVLADVVMNCLPPIHAPWTTSLEFDQKGVERLTVQKCSQFLLKSLRGHHLGGLSEGAATAQIVSIRDGLRR